MSDATATTHAFGAPAATRAAVASTSVVESVVVSVDGMRTGGR